ncbi:MAG: hypothetical protein FJ348_03660 [Sphingomonadales bacterium]|nr:hypothetical protein [Sphingomonadales bacterium]
MIAVFLKRSPLNVLLLLIFTAVVKIPLLLTPRMPEQSVADGTVYLALLDGLQRSGVGTPLFYSVLSLSMLFAHALLLNFFFSQQKMLQHGTDLPGMSYLLLTSLFPQWSYWSAPLLMNGIVLYMLFLLFRLYNRSDVGAALFNMGVLLGASYFLYKPFFLLVLWVLPAIAFMRPFRLQDWMLTLLGLITPFYFYGVWLFLTDQWQGQSLLSIAAWKLPDIEAIAFWKAGALLLLLLPLLAGLYYVQNNTRKMLIQVRRGWSVLFLLLLSTAALALFQAETQTGWMLLLIPLLFYHSCFYALSTFRVVPLLVFWLTFFYILAGQFSGSGWKI